MLKGFKAAAAMYTQGLGHHGIIRYQTQPLLYQYKVKINTIIRKKESMEYKL